MLGYLVLESGTLPKGGNSRPIEQPSVCVNPSGGSQQGYVRNLIPGRPILLVPI